MTSLTRPPYILAHPADAAGCGYHRILRPMELLCRGGYANGRTDMMLWHGDRLKTLAPDVIVWQRQLTEVQIAAIREARELLPNTFHVWEIDDCLSAVPETSPHRLEIQPDVDRVMAEAVALCDVVTTTTKTLAEHIRAVCGSDTRMRIVPNMLGRDELGRVAQIRDSFPPKKRAKPRVGWGGGISHAGDLEMLIPAMRELHNRVEWVFIGCRPNCEVPAEFHAGVRPNDYLTFLAGLGLDLILAPLVDNKFNRCKSNLRLLEAAALHCPVIASPVLPYTEGNPPVLAYAETADDWLREIIDAVTNLGTDKVQDSAVKLNAWLNAGFVMQDHLEVRARAWLPQHTVPFVPVQRKVAHDAVVVTPSSVANKTRYKVVTSLEEACRMEACDILYVRPGVSITDDQLERLLSKLREPDVASVVPLSNDGGLASYPRLGQFMPLSAAAQGQLDTLASKMFDNIKVEMTNPAGPVIGLSRRALSVCGTPDFTLSDPEAAIVEWGVTVAARGQTNAVAANVFVVCSGAHQLPDAHALLNRCYSRYPMKPVPPDPLGQVRVDLELAYLREHYTAPAPSNNTSYAEWAALFAQATDRDYHWLQEHNIEPMPVAYYPVAPDSTAWKMIAECQSEWLLLTTSMGLLAPHASYVFALAAKELAQGHIDVIYADHDFINAQDSTRDRHDFKPATFDLHLFLQRDYVTPVFAVRTAALRGVLPPELPNLLDEGVIYQAVLKLALGYHFSFRHLSHVLASLYDRPAAGTFSLVQHKAVLATGLVQERGLRVTPHDTFPMLGSLSYAGAVPEDAPLVSIIVPTGGRVEMLGPCLQTLLSITDYPNFEVLVVESRELSPAGRAFMEQLVQTDPRVRRFKRHKSYNWSAVNNWAISNHSRGELLLLLNDDTKIFEAHWLREMVGASLQPGVGAVGARLLYPHGYVQHVGVLSDVGLNGHLHKGLPANQPGYNGIAVLSHEATAVTGACLLISRAVFEQVGGLDERFAHNFNDVALCLKLNLQGFHHIVAARAQLIHIEGATRTDVMSNEGMAVMLAEAQQLLEDFKDNHDPYWNRNLVFSHSEGGALVSGLNFETLSWPGNSFPWRDDPSWSSERVLLVGDDGTGWVEQAASGNLPYFAMLQGFGVQITRPTMINVPPFDARDAVSAKAVVRNLGIDRIVVRSILGGTAEVLNFLTRLGLPIEYQPFTGEAVCPRLDFRSTLTPGEDGNPGNCGEGWKRGLCQECIDTDSSPFGDVITSSWRGYWSRFLPQVAAISPPRQLVDQLDQMYGVPGEEVI